MARYRGPSCKLCRRERIKLFLKGTKCASDKCPVSKRAYPPGEHGQGRSKLSGYALQLREKQKVKRIYGILEDQFRLYFKLAERSKGVTGQILLQLLERRLDNVIFRLNLAMTRKEARQIVRHSHVYVNDKKVNIPSFLTKKSDVVRLKLKDKQKKITKETLELLKDRAVPSWLKLEAENLSGTLLELPKREDVGFPIQERLIVELYSK
ncbi:30S ribosomal protein S4 [Omnitrophica bacterium]|nr:30S ribosomal protein S4 [Candidatus Omnitrophota bacterium]